MTHEERAERAIAHINVATPGLLGQFARCVIADEIRHAVAEAAQPNRDVDEIFNDLRAARERMKVLLDERPQYKCTFGKCDRLAVVSHYCRIHRAADAPVEPGVPTVGECEDIAYARGVKDERERKVALFVPPAWASMEREAYTRGAADERERIAKMADEWGEQDRVIWPISYTDRFFRFAAALRELPADAQGEV